MQTNEGNQARTYQFVRRKLLAGGPRLRLSRRQLAAELGVSPVSVKLALSRLQAEGLMVSKPQSGTYLRQLSGEEFLNLYELRDLIEPYAAARAARFIKPAELQLLERNCERTAHILQELERCSDDARPVRFTEKLLRLEDEFHGTILAASRNQDAARMLQNHRLLLSILAAQQRWRRQAMLKCLALTVRQHAEITAVLRRGDSRAASTLMRRHIALDAVRKNLEQFFPFAENPV